MTFKTEQEAFWVGNFACGIMKRHPEMQLIDYGFVYNRDPSFPQDDITWFLMEKR